MQQDYIITVNHVKFKPCAPDENKIYIEDIAHALSMLCRANGHFREFFSVAQHCLTCYYEAVARGYAKRVALACLLHDASEAYLSDITRPVKQHLPEYLVIESRLETAIYQHFLGAELTQEERIQVKSVDDAMLYYEFYHFTGERLYEKAPQISSEPDFSTKTPAQVEEMFLQIYWKLAGERGCLHETN